MFVCALAQGIHLGWHLFEGHVLWPSGVTRSEPLPTRLMIRAESSETGDALGRVH